MDFRQNSCLLKMKRKIENRKDTTREIWLAVLRILRKRNGNVQISAEKNGKDSEIEGLSYWEKSRKIGRK